MRERETAAWRPFLHVSWSFEGDSDDGDLNIFAGSAEGVESPLGWFGTLREECLEPTIEDAHVHFKSKDQQVDVTLDRSTAMLEKLVFVDSDPAGTMELESVEIDQPIDEARFNAPSDPIEGEDLTAQTLENLLKTERNRVRGRIFDEIVRATSGSAWDDEVRLRSERVLSALHEWSIEAWLDSWRTGTRTWIDQVDDALRARELSGTSKEDVASARASARAQLTSKLDTIRQKYLDPLSIPVSCAASDRASLLLSLEQEVAARILREQIREPLLDRFDHPAPKQE